MGLIKLKNVSKFYYSKGVIASGFSKLNLEFNECEFVAITGESGSGKSTLLNVISGLDTYEEGEMYINGDETSHYTEKDFEDYRRKYIGNIFQNFNLVNSYTVYQNIELVLLLNGNKKKEIKKQVIDLIKKVGLYKFRNTKASKLSGGQKQRVAIARALAKDTPIIIADEPTGNLDSKSAKEIIKLLSEISKNKLVIVVTHNYEQVEEFVTRKIKMHDGHILEDKKIKASKAVESIKSAKYKNITFFNRIRLSLRNTFNIIPKFLLMLAVYLFITVAIISEYASFKEQRYIESKSGENYVFSNIDDKRIIIKKDNKGAFSLENYENISAIDNVDYIVKNDLLLDSNINITDNENFWINGTANDIKNFNGELDLGRMPENDNEIIISGNKDDYYIGYQAKTLLEKQFYLQDIYTGNVDQSNKVKVVGIRYTSNSYDYNCKLYVSDAIINKYLFQINQNYSKSRYLFQNKYYTLNPYASNNKVTLNPNISDGNVYISGDLNSVCPKENCKGQNLSLEVSNLYYNETLNLTVTNTYDKKTMNKLLGINEYDSSNGSIYISVNDYNKLFNKDNFQSSVFVRDIKSIETTNAELTKLGYKSLMIKDTLVKNGSTEIIRIMGTVVTIILVFVLFFISYFVIRVILKSRNKYFSTIRMLGATKKISKQLLVMELLAVSNLAYFSFLLMIYLNKLNIISVKFINTILTYLSFKDYLILYIILTMMSYLISQKFAKKLFKNSAISTIGEEV